MYFKRWIGFALVALLFIGILSAISGAGQRDAWMQGYLAGRLSTGTDGGAAAITPYLMANGGFGPHYGWFGRGIGMFIGLGFLLFGLFLVSRRLHWRGPQGGSQNGPDDFHDRMQEAMHQAERWHERRHRRWEEPTRDRDASDEQRIV